MFAGELVPRHGDFGEQLRLEVAHAMDKEVLVAVFRQLMHPAR